MTSAHTGQVQVQVHAQLFQPVQFKLHRGLKPLANLQAQISVTLWEAPEQKDLEVVLQASDQGQLYKYGH